MSRDISSWANLQLSFNDLTVPVSGIPITITRTYDSLNAEHRGDFGYGWTLSESDFQLKVDVNGDGQLGSFGDTVPFVNGTRVVITKPDGTVEGFTFEPTSMTNLFGIVLGYQPAFIPDAGRDRHAHGALRRRRLTSSATSTSAATELNTTRRIPSSATRTR